MVRSIILALIASLVKIQLIQLLGDVLGVLTTCRFISSADTDIKHDG